MWTRFVSSVNCLRTSSVSGSGARVEALRKITYCVHARKERDRGEESERERERERAAWYNLSLNKPPGSSNHSSALQSALSYGTVLCRLQLRLCPPLKKQLRGICLKRGGTCQGNEAVAQTRVKMKAHSQVVPRSWWCPCPPQVRKWFCLRGKNKRERDVLYEDTTAAEVISSTWRKYSIYFLPRKPREYVSWCALNQPLAIFSCLVVCPDLSWTTFIKKIWIWNWSSKKAELKRRLCSSACRLVHAKDRDIRGAQDGSWSCENVSST